MTAPTEAGAGVARRVSAMKKKERWAWIFENIPEQGIDTLSREFVDSYIAATDARFIPQPYGAHTCPQLGKDLAEMRRAGLLERGRIGLAGVGYGFPKWVFVYTKKNRTGAQP